MHFALSKRQLFDTFFERNVWQTWRTRQSPKLNGIRPASSKAVELLDAFLSNPKTSISCMTQIFTSSTSSLFASSSSFYSSTADDQDICVRSETTFWENVFPSMIIDVGSNLHYPIEGWPWLKRLTVVLPGPWRPLVPRPWPPPAGLSLSDGLAQLRAYFYPRSDFYCLSP